MSEDAVADVVRQVFLAINREDEEAFLDLLDEDIEWTSAAMGLVPRSHLSGREAVRNSRREAAREGRHVHTTLQEITTDGERALVFGVVTSDGEQRGRLTLPMAWIWRIEDGRATWVESFTSRSAALHAWTGD